jgi:hypothetical protein
MDPTSKPISQHVHSTALAVLVLEVGTTEEQGVFLYGYTGEFCGDTSHQSIEDAKDQTSSEFGDALGEWEEIPPDVLDARDYALAQLV